MAQSLSTVHMVLQPSVEHALTPQSTFEPDGAQVPVPLQVFDGVNVCPEQLPGPQPVPEANR